MLSWTIKKTYREVQIGLGKIQRLICRHHGEAQLPVTCGIAGKPRIEPFRSEITRRCDRQRFGRLPRLRSEEHTSELQSLMRISYAVFCLKKKRTTKRR